MKNNNTILKIQELENIREKIENMSTFNQYKVLKIISKYKDITINENKYGIHIILNELDKTVINELHGYINYVNKQELELSNVENEKDVYKTNFF
jgi:hypothetical protein